ncbi:hypothetical protein NliqN6_0341 [Naganishia liquefaciens]|uniref:NADH dehydrogenase [ubiquinone] 1 alpha subcomplex subunit 12 n=1 Tax=Naganishia liquefaciens TaxID=104408 RepID=A0A8H3TN71_9TREE|nr:hypothetical protein NliqN6_0341 [Naganishia liquefaciens]
MSRILSRLAKLVPFGRNKPVGYDLQGNRFYEHPNPNGGRPKRFVEYKKQYDDLSEYTVRASLPIQWRSWLSFTRADPPTEEELQKDMQRQYRLAHNVKLIQERDEAETAQRKFLSAPTESSNVKPQQGQRPVESHAAPTNMPSSLHSPSAFSPHKHGHPSTKYPFTSPASTSAPAKEHNPSPSQVEPNQRSGYEPSADYTPQNDPNAPADDNLRRLSQQQTELARKRMEMHKSPLSGFAPIDAGDSQQAGRVSSDVIKGDEARGDTDAETGYAAASSVVPRPRRRGGTTPTATEETGSGQRAVPSEDMSLYRKGRVDATTKSEIQDVQVGNEEDVMNKARELGNR